MNIYTFLGGRTFDLDKLPVGQKAIYKAVKKYGDEIAGKDFGAEFRNTEWLKLREFWLEKIKKAKVFQGPLCQIYQDLEMRFCLEKQKQRSG